MGRTIYELGADGEWMELDPKEASLRPQPVIAAPPTGCITDKPDSLIEADGIAWLTWQGQLYRAVAGVCLPVFPAGQRHPFMDERKLMEVLPAPDGTVFLRTSAAEFIVLRATHLPPSVAITRQPKADAADTVAVTFSSDGGDGAMFLWRVDAGAWLLSREPQLLVPPLSRGPHRLEARAVTRELRSGVATAHLDFDGKLDVPRLVGELVLQLLDAKAGEREQIIVELARHPVDALAPLKAARAAASEDVRWWIDAAVQQLEKR